eukprot:4809185-Amphidinium_carterae.1
MPQGSCQSNSTATRSQKVCADYIESTMRYRRTKTNTTPADSHCIVCPAELEPLKLCTTAPHSTSRDLSTQHPRDDLCIHADMWQIRLCRVSCPMTLSCGQHTDSEHAPSPRDILMALSSWCLLE